jgi:LmbE family N-acetylglucosaminyl deacetylase
VPHVKGSGIRRAVGRRLESLARLRSRPLAIADVMTPAVVFAPHQDDETLGCGGLVALKRRQGVSVEVVFLTDGRTSHDGFMPAADLAARRRAEAVAACGVLGVRSDAVTFLDFPDSRLAQNREQATAAVQEILAARPGYQVFVPYRGDLTPDHVDTRRVVLAALALAGAAAAGPWEVFEYPVWFWHNWPWVKPTLVRRRALARLALGSLVAVWRRVAELNVFVDIGPVMELKQAALARHASQMERPDGQPAWPILADVAGGEWLTMFFSGREYFHRYRPAAARPRGG